MYGFSDHRNCMPLTLFSAVLQGSLRYSTRIGRVEHTFDRGPEERLIAPTIAVGATSCS